MSSRETHPYLVTYDTAGSRAETATLLVGTATEFGIPQSDIKSAPRMGGYLISQALADVLYEDTDAEPEVTEPEPEPEAKAPAKKAASKKSSATKTSGNRAAKNQPTEE